MTNGMTDLLGTMIPLLLFMLSPALLPLLGWITGALHRLVLGERRNGRQTTGRSARGHQRAPTAARDQGA